MRNGTLIKETSPSEIMSLTNTSSLEEAFYNLCHGQESSSCSYHKRVKESSISEEIFSKEENFTEFKISNYLKRSHRTSKKMFALIKKSIYSFVRQPS